MHCKRIVWHGGAPPFLGFRFLQNLTQYKLGTWCTMLDANDIAYLTDPYLKYCSSNIISSLTPIISYQGVG